MFLCCSVCCWQRVCLTVLLDADSDVDQSQSERCHLWSAVVWVCHCSLISHPLGSAHPWVGGTMHSVYIILHHIAALDSHARCGPVTTDIAWPVSPSLIDESYENGWGHLKKMGKKVKIAHTRLPSMGFRSWFLFLAVSLQVTQVINPGGRLRLLSAGPVVTLATLMKAATNFAAWWTEARWVWTVCLRLLPDSVTTVTWTQALLHLSPAR